MHIVTVDEMRNLEAQAAQKYGLTSPILIENAGKSAAEILAEYIRRQHSLNELEMLVLVGPGNNGGDGLVMARHLEQWGAHVSIYRWKEQRLTVHGREIAAEDTAAKLEDVIQHTSFVLDALLGTGRSRPVPDSMRTLLGRIGQEREQRAELCIVAIDLPTGMNADTGEVDPGTIRSDITITLACPKQGFFFFPGRDYIGELYVGDIGLPPEMEDSLQSEMLTDSTLKNHLEGYRALLLGPGLGQSPFIREVILELLEDLRSMPDEQRPNLIIDADGLNNLSALERWWTLLPPQTIITPHPGEMGRLCNGLKVSGGNIDRLELARSKAMEWRVTLGLKGACTIIAVPDGHIRIHG